MRKAASLALLAAALCGSLASAQTLYKWVDQDGKTQYSDRLPKGFKGEVTRIDTEVEKSTLPAAPVPAPVPAASPVPGKAATAAPVEDIAAKRRATRARLEDQLDKARKKVETAKEALAKADSPDPEERQIIQQRTVGGGMHGMAPRSNCRVEGTGKNKVLMCPTFVPTEEYRDKVAKLEADVRKAEEELAEAERAWRRGVD